MLIRNFQHCMVNVEIQGNTRKYKHNAGTTSSISSKKAVKIDMGWKYIIMLNKTE